MKTTIPLRPNLLSPGVFSGLAGAIIAVAVLGWSSYGALRHLLDASERVNHSTAVITELYESSHAVAQGDRAGRNYYNNGSQTIFKQLDFYQAESLRHLDKFAALTKDNPKQQERVPLYKLTTAQVFDEWRAAIKAKPDVKTPADKAAIYRIGRDAIDTLGVQYIEIRSDETALLIDRVTKAKERGASALKIVAMLCFFTLGVFFTLGYLVTNEARIRIDRETQLAEREARYRLLYQYAAEAIIMATEEGFVKEWNDGAVQLFGYTATEIIGHNLTTLMPERYRVAHQRGILRLLQGGAPTIMGRSLDVEALHKDGHEFVVTFALSVFHNDEGTFYTAVMRPRDTVPLDVDSMLKLHSESITGTGTPHD